MQVNIKVFAFIVTTRQNIDWSLYMSIRRPLPVFVGGHCPIAVAIECRSYVVKQRSGYLRLMVTEMLILPNTEESQSYRFGTT